MTKKIPKNLYDAYLLWIKAESRVNDLHYAFTSEVDKHLGPDHDSMDSGQLIVQLARKRIDGGSSKGRMSGSDPENEGSSPSPPKEKRTIVISPDGSVVTKKEKTKGRKAKEK